MYSIFMIYCTNEFYEFGHDVEFSAAEYKTIYFGSFHKVE